MADEGPRGRRFERLVRPVLGDLYRFARRLTGSDSAAEDLLQTALERGLTRLDQLSDERAFKVWQSRVLYRAWLNERAKRRDELMDATFQARLLAATPTGPEQRAVTAQMGRTVRDALQALPEDQREAIWLVDGQGFSFAEAAEVLGIPMGTAASRVGRGRVALRGSLASVAAEQGVTL